MALRARQSKAIEDVRAHSPAPAVLVVGTRSGIVDAVIRVGQMDKTTLVSGFRLGRLTLVEKVRGGKEIFWRCACECGKEKTVRQGNLIRNTRSCGCLARELSSARRKAAAMPPVNCCIDGCDKRAESKGMCGMHAQRVRRYGDPNYVTSYEEHRKKCREGHLERIGDNVKPTTYRKIHGRHAHRVIAEQMLGRPLEPGEIVHHIDGNKHNNNPANLQIMTQSQHIKTHLTEMIQIRWGDAAAAEWVAKNA
jgi:hypothetical protein